MSQIDTSAPDTAVCPLCYTMERNVCFASCPVDTRYRPHTACRTVAVFYSQDNEAIKNCFQQVPPLHRKACRISLEYRFCQTAHDQDVRALVPICERYVHGLLDSLQKNEEERRVITEQESHANSQDNRSEQAVRSSPPVASTSRISINLNSVEEPFYVRLLKKGEPSSMIALLSIADKELLLEINDHLYETAYSGNYKRTEALSDVFERACRIIIRLKESKINYVPYGILAWMACKGRDTIPGYQLQDHLTSDEELRNKIGGIPMLPSILLLREDHITRCFNVLGEMAKMYNEYEKKVCEHQPPRLLRARYTLRPGRLHPYHHRRYQVVRTAHNSSTNYEQ